MRQVPTKKQEFVLVDIFYLRSELLLKIPSVGLMFHSWFYICNEAGFEPWYVVMSKSTSNFYRMNQFDHNYTNGPSTSRNHHLGHFWIKKATNI